MGMRKRIIVQVDLRSIISSCGCDGAGLIRLKYLRGMKNWIVVMFCCLWIAGFGQRNVKDTTITAAHFALSYARQWPGGDMSSRFGANDNLGFLFNVKTSKNWMLGVDGSYIFGNKVNEPGLLSNLFTEDGEIIDNTGHVATIQIQERGFTVFATGGKVFDIVGPNPNSGILVKGGIGFMQHKIRIEHALNRINQLEDEYLKGYDRLTNGVGFSQFVGYYHMGSQRLANFFAGVEANQAFTQSRRDFNFDTGVADTQARFDILLGVRVGWVIHLYSREPEEFYTY